MAEIDTTAVRVPVGLPSAVERRLLDVVADGFVLCCCGGRLEPTALIAFYEWEHYVDLVTIRALLNLVHPQHPDAPTRAYLAPRSLHVPRHEQRPVTIRPPSYGRTGVRAARLAAAMAKSAPRLVQPNPA